MDPIIPQKTKNIPTVFIIFGATGDLMAKKIVPSLYDLYKKGKFPKLFKIIGFSRRELTEEQFVAFIQEIMLKHVKEKVDEENLHKFLSYFLYQQGNFDDITYYKKLASRMGIIDDEWRVCSNKLFYLAVPPHYYKNICENLSSSGLTIPCGPDEGWTRVIVEKPFGKDLKSAEDLDSLLAKLFKEEQIYRIDHYLAKEMLQNILAFRFANNLLEGIWNSKYIERIDIRTRESIGAEGRGLFYDGIGALRDVGQNHLLQMLALVTMENPGVLDSEHVRKKRMEILKTLAPLTPSEIKKGTYRAQYTGYKEIHGVSPHSETETYFKVLAKLSHPRWSGVLITLEAGKKLPLRKEIEITFKHPTPCLCPPGGAHFKNRIKFNLEPKEGITIKFWSKKPGLEYKFAERNLNFVFRRVDQRVQYVEEYQKLLLDCISGNQILFLSTPEIQSTWKYIDPIIQAWKNNDVPLHHYRPGSRQSIIAAKKVGNTASGSTLLKEIGIVGLGKMGGNVARRLTNMGWKVVGYNRTEDVTKSLEKEKITGAYSLEELVSKLDSPRTIINLLPTGEPTDKMLDHLLPLLNKGDIIIEMANSYYKETQKRAQKVEKSGKKFVDVGISGGPLGALNGACLMVGSNAELFKHLEPLFIDMAAPGAYAHFPGVGAGHFVKMVHNGIEYGMMQAIGEGFEVLKKSPFDLDLMEVSRIYNNGSVVESRLTQWLEEGFEKFGTDLTEVSGVVVRGGEGDWTVETAKDEKVPAKVIDDSVKARIDSEKENSYQDKVLNAMRNSFGGHPIASKKVK